MSADASFGGEEVRRLMRAARTAALATLTGDGAPYASLVKTASDYGGAPIIHVSRLAWHSRNLAADRRASLLFSSDAGDSDPLEVPRVTAIGRLAPCAGPDCAQRFLACHPGAAAYAGFSDFSFWRMEVGRCHAIAGFGRIETLDADAVVLPDEQAEAFRQAVPEALKRINEHHREALGLCAMRLLGGTAAEWRATALDADGIDVGDGKQSLRLAFPHALAAPAELDAALQALLATGPPPKQRTSS